MLPFIMMALHSLFPSQEDLQASSVVSLSVAMLLSGPPTLTIGLLQQTEKYAGKIWVQIMELTLHINENAQCNKPFFNIHTNAQL